MRRNVCFLEGFILRDEYIGMRLLSYIFDLKMTHERKPRQSHICGGGGELLFLPGAVHVF